MTASMRRHTDQLLAAALAHAARGWHVFPLRPGDKRPAISSWEARATTDTGRIRRAWQRVPFNVGIATGPSRLVVIDLDQPKPTQHASTSGLDTLIALAHRHGQQTPMGTYRVRTPNGEHLYFTAPDTLQLRNTASRIGPLIDSRAQGGYVVAAGSTTSGPYQQVGPVNQPAPLPLWLAALLTERPTIPAQSLSPEIDKIDRRSRYAAAALRGEIERVIAAPVGRRNHTLNTAAYALGQLTAAGLLPEQLAHDALALAASAAGLESEEAEATIGSGLRAGARTPRTARGRRQ